MPSSDVTRRVLISLAVMTALTARRAAAAPQDAPAAAEVRMPLAAYRELL